MKMVQTPVSTAVTEQSIDINSLQSQEQYTFIHDVILESVTCGDTQISSGEFSETNHCKALQASQKFPPVVTILTTLQIKQRIARHCISVSGPLR